MQAGNRITAKSRLPYSYPFAERVEGNVSHRTEKICKTVQEGEYSSFTFSPAMDVCSLRQHKSKTERLPIALHDPDHVLCLQSFTWMQSNSGY
jgi:hypothetical protein